MLRFTAIMQLVLATSLFTTSSLATENTDRIVVFGGATDYAPFHYRSTNNKAEGFDVELFYAIARVAGWQTDERLGDWSAIQSDLEAGRVDVVPMFMSAEREQLYRFSVHILTEHHRLFGLRGGAALRGLEDLDGYKVAVEEAGYAWRFLQQENTGAELIATDSEAAAIRLVASGKADRALVTTHTGYYTIARQNLDEVVALSPPMLPADYAFAVNPDRPGLIHAINEALLVLQEQGVLDRLQHQWLSEFEPVDWRTAVRELLWLLIPLGILIIAGGWMLWRYRYRWLAARGAIESEALRRRSAEDRARKLSVNDELTGLPKRGVLHEYLDSTLITARKRDTRLAVGMLTLLEVEYIQQIVGDQVTERFIVLAANALAEMHQGFVAYLGEGRFAFVFENISDTDDAGKRMQALNRVAGQEFNVYGTSIEGMVASGLAVYPEHGSDAAPLLRAARIATSQARTQRATDLVYSPSFEPDPRNLTLMSDLKKALSTGGLSWALQPQYAFGGERIIGAELLIRWQHSRYGWVRPDLFIPMAEKTGLIKQVTREVIRLAVDTLRQWEANDNDWRLSINISGNDLADAAIVDDIIEKFGSYARRVTLEMTETAVMEDVGAITTSADRIRAAGFHLALDDYGTGYSSLEYLKRLHFDEIKIDMTFIKNIADSRRDLKLTEASILLAHELNAVAVAEGVEDMQIAGLLRKLGCDILQGYGIAKPLAPGEFAQFSENYTIRPQADPEKYRVVG
jgi:EAL domain-containing protein (putative c-di-GMP-specific phosphodiesterase class I)/ABC-type amino acid transport substrate-binding protein/GGDEF domain-containing protein